MTRIEVGRRRRGPGRILVGGSVTLLLALVGAPASAQSPARADELLDKGNYLFKAGYYFKASEHYRLALLEDPGSATKKLAFGHALFAIGNYSYASYALRRGVAELDPDAPFRPDVASLFPSRRAFVQALRDLKRYVTYSPRDPAGLTVLGYVLSSIDGEERRCRDIFQVYLKRLDPNDPFAEFLLRQLARRATLPPPSEGPLAENPSSDDPSVVRDLLWRGKSPEDPPFPPAEPVEPQPTAPPPVAEAPKPEAPTPPPAPDPSLEEVLPQPQRHDEQLENQWPAPTPAPAR